MVKPNNTEIAENVAERAKRSLGASSEPIYEMVRRTIGDHHSESGVLIDVGCGTGRLWSYLSDRFGEYHGIDAVKYDGFPETGSFHLLDIDSGKIPLPDSAGDVVVAVETIEHVENPRAFFRELRRLCRPGGLIVVTTPNQLSMLSKLTLLFKNEFNAFQASDYPAHITALLEVDLKRIASECNLEFVKVHFTESGRLPGTARRYPHILSRFWPRAFSDNIAIATKVKH